MRFFWAVVLATFPLVGCAAETPDESVGSRTEWIVGGELDSTPQVVMLYNARSGGLCTGSLIAPRVVLTAKHCVQREGAPEPDPPGAFTIGFGDNINRLTDTLRAVEITAPPGAYGSRLSGLTGADIGLITLQTGISAFEPLAVHRGDGDDLVGNDIIAIGFGQTPEGRSGTKYRGTGRVRFTDGEVLYITPILCQGDSGGPVIDVATGDIVAVNSFVTGACGAGGIAGTNRVDIFLDLIDLVVGASGACLNDGDERCDGFDNDCDDLIDETCLALGTECTLDEECLGTNCADTPAGRLCTAPCDPLRPELSCATGLYCARTSGCAGLCVPRPTVTGPMAVGEGAPCAEDLDCLSLFCADPGDGERRCLTPCRGDDGTCFAGEVCAASAGECGGCVNEDIVRGARGLGEGCAEDGDCGSASCFEEAPGLSYCTRSCEVDSDCGSRDRFHCRDSICIRGAIGGIGDSCLENGDCADATFCAARAGVSWCTTFCSDAEPCPDGFDCTDVGEASLCVPVRGVVGDTCAADDECISGVCSVDAGVCSRICSPDSPCPGAFECERTMDGTSAFCVGPTIPPPPPPSGGCAVSSSAPLPTLVALLAPLGVFILAFARRRSRAGLREL